MSTIASPNADDNGPGDKARPFRTINKAAQILQPGERVVIAAGTYRECVRPARGGTGPAQMISYEAAPGAKVFIKGSEVLKDGWQQETVAERFNARPRRRHHRLAPRADERAVSRRLQSLRAAQHHGQLGMAGYARSWTWARICAGVGWCLWTASRWSRWNSFASWRWQNLPPVPDFTKPPCRCLACRRAGAAAPIMQEIGGSPDARFSVDNPGPAIHVRLASGTPADHMIEVTTRQHAFIPAQSGTGYIRVKGITFQHAGNAYPFPQYGMVSLAGGDHWILEDNTIEWANGVGLDIGSDGNSGGAPHPGASQIVRRNTFRYCGIEGIGGMGTSNTLMEDNLIEWCGWADAERGWEAAGAKFHRAKNMLFRRNVIRHMRHANAAWWDVDNANCRITKNIFADVLTVGAAIHMEMNPGQNSIDNNIIWDVRNAEPGTPGQRGCAGIGHFRQCHRQSRSSRRT